MKLFWPQQGTLEAAVTRLTRQSLHQPFSDEVIAFTQSLSKRFIKIREMPEIVALGFWLRKTNILKFKEQFEQERFGKIVRPRGTVFHIAPSNVDTIFVYSWMLSLLAGNRNVIRVSSKEQNGINRLLTIILEELAQCEFPTIANETIICTYGHEENGTEILSEKCHTRVIWGGDETIRVIRQVPLAPLANELVFPDRFSLAILQSDCVEKLTDKALDQLVEQFYNDVFWFDQLACSSPRLVVWQGKKSDRFWRAFERKIQLKKYELLAATQVLKYTTSMLLATEDEVEKFEATTYFSRVHLTNVSADIRDRHCGGGLFYEYEIAELHEMAQIIIDKDQTIAYFGFERSELQQLVEAVSTRGIDRIVPIGQALDFNGVWDGQNFLTSFTREVVIV